MKDSIYVVTGLPRSGTSMLMRCLGAGGMQLAYNDEHDEETNRIHGSTTYHPNPNGYFEPPYDFFGNPGYMKYNNHVLKLHVPFLEHLPQASYQVVFIKRNPSELRRSIINFFGSEGEYRDILNDYDRYISNMTVDATNRGIPFITIDYNKILVNPYNEFQTLQWEFDKLRASEMVDNNLYRFRA